MSENNIKPEKITKPIQMLGAWLVGLLSINSCFLIAAANMDSTSWQSGALVIAAIVNVPIFLLAVFLLQTKFRPELQEDSYYSSYLSHKTNKVINVRKENSAINEINSKLNLLIKNQEEESTNSSSKSNFSNILFGVNRHLDDKDKIISELDKKGVLHCNLFGPLDNLPEKRGIAVSRYLSSKTIQEILLLAKKLGFEYYNLFDNIEEQSREEVLLGAYGNPSEYKPIE